MAHSDPIHDDVIKWKHFPRYWPFARGIHRSPVNSPHKDQWRGALMFSLICVWINGWVNNGEAGDLRRSRTHYDVTVIIYYPDNATTADITWDAQRCDKRIVVRLFCPSTALPESAVHNRYKKALCKLHNMRCIKYPYKNSFVVHLKNITTAIYDQQRLTICPMST